MYFDEVIVVVPTGSILGAELLLMESFKRTGIVNFLMLPIPICAVVGLGIVHSSGKGTAGNCKRTRICRAGALGSFTRSEVTQVSVTHCSLPANPSLWK